ncbi:MAG: UDP-2,4-diacetamido-2,4,6-trideoxy-beta-L-altropyranose hydrolase [Bacteroidales bacterium]|nr:UDP-2,4-diacetamido-2,4,6-trideoxy-beta-L-altropyranose hydrolase [Bacteroidales bacterium]MCM1415512.1 UDP-2,4-diacetamido-2,4,6-trideoxy-beta-L-altropyranose hydrolase [bacterium]MCM1423712.1 UDP-2,4-diacetamido-2,4,6-trideoxy-beta-L-altropyranose hydrolase [bacterium]
MEIGSIFEIDPAAAGAGKEAAALHLAQTEKYGKAHCCFTASGREAIELALISLEREKPDIPKRCLMPAYMCDSVFQPFAHRGWELVFYTVDRKLVSYGEELFRLALTHDPGLIFLHPYYGTDTCRELRMQVRALRKSGIFVMEDVTQSYYLEDAGKEADFVVGSLRKWYPVPDGGFAASDIPLAEDVLRTDEEHAEERFSVLAAKWAYLHDAASLRGSQTELQEKKDTYLAGNRALEEDLDRYEGIRRISRRSAAIMVRTDEAAAARKRAENHDFLYEKMIGMRRLRPILNKGGGEAPLYFPIYAKERDSLQAFLRERDIYAPVLWPIGEENRDALSGDEDYIYRHMLALPIDQRYGAAEMERIGAALTEYEGQRVVGIRADANDTVATGHIMRCITIAEALERKGFRTVFFTADEEARELLAGAGMEQICLHTAWDHMEEELPRLREVLRLAGVGVLLVDSYQATPAYFEGLRDLVKLAYLDDCFEAVYPVDLLINYNAYHTQFPYEESYGGRTRLLLGTEYVPLRREFALAAEEMAWQKEFAQAQAETAQREEIAQEEEVRESAGNGFSVLLASGGGDAENALPGILERAANKETLKNVTFHVAAGVYHPKGEELEAFADAHENVRVYRPCQDMAGLMRACDAAVSAAGTMLFELSAMQVPTVFFQTADNQRYDSAFFAKEERMLDAGDIRQDREACLEAVCAGLERIIQDESLRARMREKLSLVTDGQGAERIAEEIAQLAENGKESDK